MSLGLGQGSTQIQNVGRKLHGQWLTGPSKWAESVKDPDPVLILETQCAARYIGGIKWYSSR